MGLMLPEGTGGYRDTPHIGTILFNIGTSTLISVCDALHYALTETLDLYSQVSGSSPLVGSLFFLQIP